MSYVVMGNAKRMAIMRNVRFGVVPQTTGVVGLSFDSIVAEGVGARHVLTVEDAEQMLAELNVADVSQLDGKPVWVQLGIRADTGAVVVTFDGPCLV
jgi:hypothetical protein